MRNTNTNQTKGATKMETLTGTSYFRKDKEVIINSVTFNINRNRAGEITYRLDGLYAKTKKMKKFHFCNFTISNKKLTFGSLWDYGTAFSFYELNKPSDLLSCDFKFKVCDLHDDKFRNDALLTDLHKNNCIMELHNMIDRVEESI
tara:strand:+ start:106 stop:543 length:438 start_codon:yes stop_codon:yes gene_type:complete